MKIVLAGGSGQIGHILQGAFEAKGHQVLVLTRLASPSSPNCVPWDGSSLGPWVDQLEGTDILINLAGRSVNCRYHPRHRREIIDSRVQSTRVLGAALAQLKSPPSIWLQSSTATIYAHTYGAPNDEFTGTIGGNEPNVPETWRFSIEVATAWEKAFDELELPHTRKVKLRSAMVMSPDSGGVFHTLLGLVRRRLGGRSGDGKQFVSWIHERDFVRALEWIIGHPELSGAINLCSPNPLTNDAFMRALREAAGVRFGLPAANWMLEIGAFFMRTETELILKSRRVAPGRLLQSGFQFEFPDWPAAARELATRST